MTTKIRVINWPEDFKELKNIEEHMVCGICYEYMETPVITSCAHSYCSLCIRKYLHYKTECPACFAKVFDKDLYINRNVDSIIQSYLQIREKLALLTKERVNSIPETPLEAPVTPVTKPNFIGSPIKPDTQTTTVHSLKESSLIKTPSSTQRHVNELKNSPSTSSLNSPSISGTVKPIARIFSTPKTIKKETIVFDIEKVSCPVCQVDVPKTQINKHLDACLSRQDESSKQVKRNHSKRPPLPKLVLKLMKESELKKKMKDFGLPVNGDRRVLENRYMRYTTIYNAENDKLNPRPIADLIKQCEQEEKMERKMDDFLVSTPSTSTMRLQVDRNAKEEVIEEAQKKYLDANKSSFDKLIEEVRNRQKQKKETNIMKQEINEEELQPIQKDNSTPIKLSQKSSIHPSPDKSFSDSTYVESDSDQSCPLQIYQGNDTVIEQWNYSPSSVSNTPKKPRMSILERLKMNRSIEDNIKYDEKNEENHKIRSPKSVYDEETDKETAEENSPVLLKSGKGTKKRNSRVRKNLTEPEEEQKIAIKDEILKDFIYDDSSIEFESNLNEVKTNAKSDKSYDSDAIDKIIGANSKEMKADIPVSEDNRINNSEDDLDLEIMNITMDPKILPEKENSDPLDGKSALPNPSRSNVGRPQRRRVKTKRFGEDPEDFKSDGLLKRRRASSRLKQSDSSLEENQNPTKRPFRRKQVPILSSESP